MTSTTRLHIVSEFVDPETAHLPAEGNHCPVAQTVGHLAVTIRVRMPAASIDLKIQPVPLRI